MVVSHVGFDRTVRHISKADGGSSRNEIYMMVNAILSKYEVYRFLCSIKLYEFAFIPVITRIPYFSVFDFKVT